MSENGKRPTSPVHVFAWVLAGVIGAQVVLAPPASAFECPEPQAQGVAGVIAESPQEIAKLSAMLRAGDLENRLGMTAHELKQKYPKADKTELTNYMMTAYCPVIAADRGLSDSEKEERLDRFSEEVWKIYSDQGP